MHAHREQTREQTARNGSRQPREEAAGEEKTDTMNLNFQLQTLWLNEFLFFKTHSVEFNYDHPRRLIGDL